MSRSIDTQGSERHDLHAPSAEDKLQSSLPQFSLRVYLHRKVQSQNVNSG